MENATKQKTKMKYNIPSWKNFECLSVYSFFDPSCFNDLPEQSSVYGIESDSLGLIYIGQTMNLKRRMMTHEKKSLFVEKESVRVYYYLTQEKGNYDNGERLDIERNFIERYNPLLNNESKKRPFSDSIFSFKTKDILLTELKKIHPHQLRFLARQKRVKIPLGAKRREWEELVAERLIKEKELLGFVSKHN